MGLAIDKTRDHIGGDNRMMVGQNGYDFIAYQLLGNRLITPVREEGFVRGSPVVDHHEHASGVIHVRQNQISQAPQQRTLEDVSPVRRVE